MDAPGHPGSPPSQTPRDISRGDDRMPFLWVSFRGTYVTVVWKFPGAFASSNPTHGCFRDILDSQPAHHFLDVVLVVGLRRYDSPRTRCLHQCEAPHATNAVRPQAPRPGSRRVCNKTNLQNKGLISADRGTKATLVRTIPRSLFKSYTKDLLFPIFELAFQLRLRLLLWNHSAATML